MGLDSVSQGARERCRGDVTADMDIRAPGASSLLTAHTVVSAACPEVCTGPVPDLNASSMAKSAP